MRKFRVDASKKITSAIVPYRQSTSDLINNEGLDGRFDYDLPETFAIDMYGTPTTCLTVDSEVVPMADYDPWIEVDDYSEEPTCIKFTVLVPLPPECREVYNYGTVQQWIYGGLEQYLHDELEGSDYCWIIGNVTISADEYSYLMDLAKDKLDNTESNIGYGLAEVTVMPVCP